jgi:hypothetical protein
MIATKQLEAMLARYQDTLNRHFKIMGSTYENVNLSRAKSATEAALLYLKRGDTVASMHLVGFVQGVLLCQGLHTWEYLISDDKRL